MDKKTTTLSKAHHERTVQSMEKFVLYVSSPWRVVWVNFIAGVFRGLGTVIGASIVIAAMIWLLSLFTWLPLIGEYARRIENAVSQYADDINYNDEFARIGDTLERIEANLKQQDSNTDTSGQ